MGSGDLGENFPARNENSGEEQALTNRYQYSRGQIKTGALTSDYSSISYPLFAVESKLDLGPSIRYCPSGFL